MKKEGKGKIPWDDPIEDENLKNSWIDYFGMLTAVDDIKFKRCLKPENALPDEDPDLVTFNDGNPDAFGVSAYILYKLDDSSQDKYAASLVMSKAKLGPIAHLGETSRNELNGGVLAGRLNNWIVQESGLRFRNHYHFLDSMIVHEMIRKSSYGFNTFAGLRVGEIQLKTNLEDWRHIPSKENIADILTKGAPPSKIGPGSTWMNGPSWLSQTQSEWQ